MLSDADLYCEQLEDIYEYDKTAREKLVDARADISGSKPTPSFLRTIGLYSVPGRTLHLTLNRNGLFLLVVVWIDDLDIAYANTDESFFDEFATAHGKRFMGKFIGLKITRDRDARTLTLSQELHIEKMADRLLPNKTLRKSTSIPVWFTDKAQPASTFSKLAAL
eukprot:715746-Pleurochrysis_carterae.AAC.1